MRDEPLVGACEALGSGEGLSRGDISIRRGVAGFDHKVLAPVDLAALLLRRPSPEEEDQSRSRPVVQGVHDGVGKALPALVLQHRDVALRLTSSFC